MTLDELIIKLLIDPSGVKQGAKEATAATAKLSAEMVAGAEKGEKAQTSAFATIAKGWNAMAAMQRKAAAEHVQNSKAMAAGTETIVQSGEKALRTFGALFLLFAGASSVKSFVTDMLGVDAALGRTAKSIGQTPEALSGIGRAVERMGGTFNGAVGGLKGLSDAFESMRTTGNSAITEPMARLQGLSGKAITFGKDVHENFLSIADALKAEMGKDPAMADYLGRQILGDEGLTNLAKKGRAGVLAEEGKSPRITRQQTEAAQKLQEQLTAVRQGFQDIGNSILMTFGPAMVKAAEWVKDLVDKNRGLIESKVSEWVKDVGTWFTEHKSDVEAFGKAVGDLATAAGSLATAFASQSPAVQALELFAATMGGTVLRAVTGLSGALGTLFALPAPAWFLALNPAVLGTAAVGAVLASGDPKKALLSGGHPDVTPQDNNTGLPGVDNGPSDTDAAKGKISSAWSWFAEKMKKLGFGDRLHDDAKTKESIDDTAKATKEMRDLMKAQKDGLGGDAANAGGGSGGGSGGGVLGAARRTLGYAAVAAGGQAGRGGGPAALRSEQQKANAAAIADELRKAGAPDEGVAAVLGSMQTESSFSPRAHNDVTGGHTGLWQWDARRWPKIRAWIEKQGGDPWDARWQTKAYIAEGRAQPGDAIYDNGETSGGFKDVMDSKGNLPKAVHGVQRSERFGRGEEGGRAAHAAKWLGRLPGKDEPTSVATASAASAPATSSMTAEEYDALSKAHYSADRTKPWSAEQIRQWNADADKLDAYSRAHPAARDAAPKRYAPGTYANGKPVGTSPEISPDARRRKATDDDEFPTTVTPDAAPAPTPKRAAHAARTVDIPETSPSERPTLGHAVHKILGAIAHANRLTHHNDNHPVPVTDAGAMKLQERTFGAFAKWGARHPDQLEHARALRHGQAAALDRMTRVAMAGSYASRSTHNVDRSVTSDTKVGTINIHTAATDAHGIAADIEPHLHRGQAAGRADYGLA